MASRAEWVVSPLESIPDAARLYQEELPEREWQAMQSWFTTFYPFQLRWLLEPKRRAACVKARQIGWSHTTAGNAVLWGAFHGELTTIVSKGELESQEVLEKARRHTQVLAALGSGMAVPVRANSEELHFASGGRIIALPSSGGRGFTGNVILDEYAYQAFQAKVWDAASAATMLGMFRLRVISTPNGVGDGFHDLVDAIRMKRTKGYALHSVTIHDAIAHGYPVDLTECLSIAKGDPRIFDQLFECKFLDSAQQYIPTDAIRNCSQHPITRPARGMFYAGLDIGRSIDRSVLIVIHVDEQLVRRVVMVLSCKRTSPELLHGLVATAFQTFPSLVRLCVDATGIGAFEADRMKAQYGQQRVEAVIFNSAVKEEMASALYSCCVHATLKMPTMDDSIVDPQGKPLLLEEGTATQLREDLCSLKRIITSAGNVRYDAPHTDQGHGDAAWALGLALHGQLAPVGRVSQRTVAGF